MFAAGAGGVRESSAVRGTTGRAAEESVSGSWPNTIAKCHGDIFGVGFFPPAKMLTEPPESSLSYTPWQGQGQTGGGSCSEHIPTLSTQKNIPVSRDGLRVKSDFALCLLMQLDNRGRVSSQIP